MTCGPSRNVFIFVFGGICASQHHKNPSQYRCRRAAAAEQTLGNGPWSQVPPGGGGDEARLPSTAHCALPILASLPLPGTQ